MLLQGSGEGGDDILTKARIRMSLSKGRLSRKKTARPGTITARGFVKKRAHEPEFTKKKIYGRESVPQGRGEYHNEK